MIGDLFSTDAFVALNKGLDASALRQQVIANNVANVNTPGYKKQEVSFEEEFARAVDNNSGTRLLQTESGHLPGGSSLRDVGVKITASKGMSMRYDGNSVDIDEEMSNLAENNIRFMAMSKLLADRFSSMKMVINGGR